MADTFQLDISAAGLEILQGLAAPVVKQSAEAIAARARSMAASMSTETIEFQTSNHIGTITNGVRAIATVTANGLDAHQAYIADMALIKSKDAGQV
jgi:hypothetical protein